MQYPATKIAMMVSEVLGAMCVPLALTGAPAALAQAVESATLTADIPAQPLAQALAEFSRQTDLNLVYVSEVVREKKSRAVSAGLRAEAALGQLLQGTGLKFEYLSANTVRILAPELAQPPPTEQGGGAAADIQIFVTGSRIPRAPNDISISPIISVTADDIQKTGLVHVDDILDYLPMISAEAPPGISISTPGINTVSLRDLGSQRTLVLVNGRRMNPGGAGGIIGPGGNSKAVDLNQIPAELIERIDVLTGGASAIYGADAVAGVINFVLNTHYQGVKIDAQYGFNNHQNNNSTYLGYIQNSPYPVTTPPSTVNTGQTKNLSVLIGGNFADDKGNATAYATYLNQLPAVGYQFDHAGCALIGGSHPNDPITCDGSGTSAHGQFLMLGQVGGVTTTIVDNTVDPKTGAFRPFNGSDLYNYGALTYFQRQFERWTAGAFLTYDVSKHASVYSETMFAHNTSQAQYGASGSFFELAKTNCANPLLTASEVAQLCAPATLAENQAAYGLTGNNFDIYVGRRSVESGGRQDNYSSWSIRQVLGVKGEINDVWAYDVYGQLGISSLQNIGGNFLGTPQIDNALQAVAGPGGPACAVGPPCVPWNVWVPNGVTPAQLKYLSTAVTYSGTSTEYLWDGSVTGNLGKYGMKLPTANSGINIAIGTEYRQEKFVFSPDYVYLNAFQSGGASVAALNGQFHVWEGFTELRVPLIDEKPGAYLLSMDAGYRYSSYTEGFNTDTYKVGLEWAPIQDVRLRGGYNRAVRTPNINELYGAVTISSSGIQDPCSGTAPLLPLAECERTGVTATEYGHIAPSAAGYYQEVGGNTSLTPEIADTYTYGVVFQPQALPEFTATVDAFSIKIRNTITSLPPGTIMNTCASTGDPSLCGLIHRGPSGSLWLTFANFVQTTDLNIGTVSTKGLDVAGHYRLNMAGMGTLNFGLVGTHVRDFLSTVPTTPGIGIAAYDCAGYWGSTCGAPLPKWRHVLNTTWATPWAGFDATIRWRYIGSSAVDRSSSDPQLAAPFYPQTAHIPAYNYIDLSFAIPIGRTLDLRLGVNNIADKDPPLILGGNFSDCPATSCNDNTWTGTYDTLGRYIYTHLSAKF